MIIIIIIILQYYARKVWQIHMRSSLGGYMACLIFQLAF